jgi:hypothetical protein
MFVRNYSLFLWNIMVLLLQLQPAYLLKKHVDLQEHPSKPYGMMKVKLYFYLLSYVILLVYIFSVK